MPLTNATPPPHTRTYPPTDEDHPDRSSGSYTDLRQYYPNVDGNLTQDSDKARVLGGEASMWLNHYCAAGQRWPGPQSPTAPAAGGQTPRT